MLRLLMLQIGVQVNGRNKNGDTPLMIACTANDLETSFMLIDSGAEVNVANSTGNLIVFCRCTDDHMNDSVSAGRRLYP